MATSIDTTRRSMFAIPAAAALTLGPASSALSEAGLFEFWERQAQACDAACEAEICEDGAID